MNPQTHFHKKSLCFALLAASFFLAIGPAVAGAPQTKVHKPTGDEIRVESAGLINIKTGGTLQADGDITSASGLFIDHETFLDPVAVDSNTFITDLPVDTGTLVAMTTTYTAAAGDFLAQPTHPRTLSFVLTDTGGDSTGTITVTGVTGNGDTVSEALSFNAANLGLYQYTSNAFLQLTSIAITYTAVGGVDSEKFWVGTSTGLGLANDLTAAADLIQAVEAGADATTGTLNTTYDTYTPASAPNGTRDYDLYYKVRSNPVVNP